jgi:hypothetical protein
MIAALPFTTSHAEWIGLIVGVEQAQERHAVPAGAEES